MRGDSLEAHQRSREWWLIFTAMLIGDAIGFFAGWWVFGVLP